MYEGCNVIVAKIVTIGEKRTQPDKSRQYNLKGKHCVHVSVCPQQLFESEGKRISHATSRRLLVSSKYLDK